LALFGIYCDIGDDRCVWLLFLVVVGLSAWVFSIDGQYLPSGPYPMSVPGGVPLASDFDGDGLADPAMVINNHWTFWFSKGGYMPSGPYPFVPQRLT